LFNGAFFMPDLIGFGALLAVVLFVWSLLSIRNVSRSTMVSSGFLLGLWWGILVFFPQLYWVWSVLYTFSERSFFLKIAVYCLLCSSFAFTSACWVGSMMFIGWYIRSNIGRMMTYLFVSISYFIWLGERGALILASGDGYPLINPLIPLCAYRWFIQSVCLISSLVIGPNYFYAPLPTSCTIAYLKPLVTQQNKHLADPSSLGQQIYHQLSDMSSFAHGEKKQIKKRLYCGAESFFPFSLNTYPELVTLWGAAISENTQVLLGAHYQHGEKIHQAAFFIKNCRIKKIYVKKHLVPFIEYIPYAWSALKIGANLLSKHHEMFSCGKNARYNKALSLENDFNLLPQICSEFIFSHTTRCFRRHLQHEKSVCVIWLVNDSWFISSFKRILLLGGCLRGAWIGLPVISISHELISTTCGINRLGF